MWSLKYDTTNLSMKQKQNQNVENRLVEIEGKDRVEQIERRALPQIHYRVKRKLAGSSCSAQAAPLGAP